MENIFEVVVQAILKVFKVAFRIMIEIFLPDILEKVIKKFYRNNPKTTICLSIICLILLLGMVIYIFR